MSTHEDATRIDAQQFPILAVLFPDERTFLEAMASRTHYLPGVPIIQEGQRPETLFLVHEGLLKVNKRHGDRIIEVGSITPGDVFGEASILYGSPAGASVISIESSVLYELPGDAVRRILDNNERFFRALSQLAEQRVAASALAVNPLFAVLPQAVREVILHNGRILSLDAGEQLFQEGQREEGVMYLVLQGEAEISIPHPEEKDRKLVLAKATSGDEIGEIALVCDMPHAATVTAITPLKLLTIRKESVLAWKRRYPAFRDALYQCVADKMQRSYHSLSALVGEEKAQTLTKDHLPSMDAWERL
ncbi:MAG: cyclic nucleotide-binding domain-containing protein [Zetaproteobacteria bacterium]|nr:MAG: cyclic nucleotide-binding domain-containing protein [Zetaproteobacteria bacterium]